MISTLLGGSNEYSHPIPVARAAGQADQLNRAKNNELALTSSFQGLAHFSYLVWAKSRLHRPWKPSLADTAAIRRVPFMLSSDIPADPKPLSEITPSR